jgi:hypothetical protein
MAKLRQDFVEHLLDQLSFLEESGRAFDAGRVGEAKRLAVVVRVLLHDTAKSKSLLGQMKLKERMSYLNTSGPYNPRNLLPHMGLVSLKMTTGSSEGGTEYVALLGDRPPDFMRQTSFNHWWDEIVIKDDQGEMWTRRQITLHLSNKEGGAHVDERLTAKYDRLANDNALGWMYVYTEPTGSSVERAAKGNPAYASMRQVAYELEMTLKRELPSRVPGFTS